MRDEHNAILSLPSRDSKSIAVRALAAAIFGSDFDFLGRGDFVVFVLHGKVLQKQWAFSCVSGCAIGRAGRKRCRRSGGPENVERRINGRAIERMTTRYSGDPGCWMVGIRIVVENKEEKGARCRKRCMS